MIHINMNLPLSPSSHVSFLPLSFPNQILLRLSYPPCEVHTLPSHIPWFILNIIKWRVKIMMLLIMKFCITSSNIHSKITLRSTPRPSTFVSFLQVSQPNFISIFIPPTRATYHTNLIPFYFITLKLPDLSVCKCQCYPKKKKSQALGRWGFRRMGSSV
jgi:hypothetical protein